MNVPDWWVVPRDWPGETVFIVGGGPSVLEQDVELLRGRRVIAINSSYQRVPFADYVIAHDHQWWREHKDRIQATFQGQMVAPTEHRQGFDGRLYVHKRYPPMSSDPGWISMKVTTFSGAINLAVHKGASKIVLLGADGKLGKDGRSHHYEPHCWWKFRTDRWDKHRAELQTFIGPLKLLRIEVLNASPGSAWDLWPVVTLEQAIEERRAAA